MKQQMFLKRQGGMAVGVGLLCLAGALNAQAQQAARPEWRTYSYPTDGFSVSMPSAPSLNKQSVNTEYYGPVELRAYVTEDGSTVLYVAVCDYGPGAAGRDPDKVLQGAKNGFINNVKAHIVSEGRLSLGIYPGVKFEAESDTLRFSAQVYYVGTTLYQTLLARGLNETYSNPDTFFNSFQLIPRTRN